MTNLCPAFSYQARLHQKLPGLNTGLFLCSPKISLKFSIQECPIMTLHGCIDISLDTTGRKCKARRVGMTNLQITPHTKVGIFCCVNKTIIGEAVQQEKGEAYGDAIQYGGHYEFWDSLVPVTVQERKFKSHSYDFFPRGKIVLFRKRQTVRL